MPELPIPGCHSKSHPTHPVTILYVGCAHLTVALTLNLVTASLEWLTSVGPAKFPSLLLSYGNFLGLLFALQVGKLHSDIYRGWKAKSFRELHPTLKIFCRSGTLWFFE